MGCLRICCRPQTTRDGCVIFGAELRSKKKGGRSSARKYVETGGFIRSSQAAGPQTASPSAYTGPAPSPAAPAGPTPAAEAGFFSRSSKFATMTASAGNGSAPHLAGAASAGGEAGSAANCPVSVEKSPAGRPVKRAFNFMDDSQTEYVPIPTAQKKRSGELHRANVTRAFHRNSKKLGCGLSCAAAGSRPQQQQRLVGVRHIIPEAPVSLIFHWDCRLNNAFTMIPFKQRPSHNSLYKPI